MATDTPIIVTDADDLRRAFTAHIYGFTLGITERYAERLAGSLIECMRASCPPPEVEPVVLSWDYGQQPDLDELAAAIDMLTVGGLRLIQVDTQSSDIGIVLSTTELDEQAVDALWTRHEGGE